MKKISTQLFSILFPGLALACLMWVISVCLWEESSYFGSSAFAGFGFIFLIQVALDSELAFLKRSFFTIFDFIEENPEAVITMTAIGVSAGIGIVIEKFFGVSWKAMFVGLLFLTVLLYITLLYRYGKDKHHHEP